MTTVLVVEDEALIAGDIQQTLLRLGYDVPITLSSGESAVDITNQLKPSLVLMDIKLRGAMDGIETAAAIRSRFDVPIVYLTSHSDEATLSRAKATNPHGYLLKPFSDRELRTAIEVALNRHVLEVRLALRERWFSTTLRSIGDAVIATDADEKITFLNGVAEKLTGWGQEAMGRPISDVFQVVDPAGVRLPSPVGLALERSVVVDLPANSGLVVKNGSQIAVDDSASPIIDDKGALLGGVVIFRDVTERRQLEKRLVQTERLASLGTMAAGMAHEINNPLTYVIANIEMSLENLQRAITTVGAAAGTQVGDLLAELRSALTEAGVGAERVRQVVQDLRKLAGNEESTASLTDLTHALEVAIKMTAHAVNHHARVRSAFGSTPLVEASEASLGQVFTNLLVNAAQAIGDGRADSNEIVVSTYTNPAGAAVVEVRDTGPGFSADVQAHLFDPFFTTKAVGIGMGLGLAICHKIIGSLGGQIVAENAPGGGALFRVTLPAATRHRPSVEPGPKPAGPAVRRGNILVIDDDAAVGRALARMLRVEHEVKVTVEGAEAIALIAMGATFDAIFCDLMMPNTSGQQLYEQICALDPELAGRVVFMTGGAFSPTAQRFLAEVPNVRVQKPFSPEAVRAIARTFVK